MPSPVQSPTPLGVGERGEATSAFSRKATLPLGGQWRRAPPPLRAALEDMGRQSDEHLIKLERMETLHAVLRKLPIPAARRRQRTEKGGMPGRARTVPHGDDRGRRGALHA